MPDDLTQREERIRALAQRMWEAAGKPPGQDADFWHRAEAEIDAVDAAVNRSRTPKPGASQ